MSRKKRQSISDDAEFQALWAEKLAALTLNSTVDEVSSYMSLTPGGSAARPYEFLRLHEAICSATAPEGRAQRAGLSFWRWIASEWSGFDRIPRTYGTYFRIWCRYWSPECMAPEARATYDALPAAGIAVFRGQDRCARIGLSWTLDRTVAENFARGHRGLWNPAPIVLATTVSKRAVAFVDPGRNEAEIVLFRPPQRQRVRTEPGTLRAPW